MSNEAGNESGERAEFLPEEYKPFCLDEVRPSGEMLTLIYAGNIFGGVVRCQLPEGVESALKPGVKIFVRYHDADTGNPGQIAHIVVRDEARDQWAEVYSDD